MKIKTLKVFYYALISISLFLAFERAAEMYITVDEAITYTDHIRPRISGVFDFSAANNHLLNTVLAKVLATFAPYSELALRIPSLAVGGWFFFAYIPRKFQNWSERLLFAAACLFPYYISEYWSLSRGYFMSTCFGTAALIEISASFSASSSESAFARSRILASLSVLASFVMLPFAVVIGIATVLLAKKSSLVVSVKRLLSDWSSWLIFCSCAISAFAIHSFKAAGEALSYTDLFSIFAPIDAVAGSLVTGNWISVFIFKTLTIASVILFLIRKDYRSLTLASIIIISLILIWIGGSFGTGFPATRSWIPYWFMICLLIVDGFNAAVGFIGVNLIGIASAAAGLATLVNTFFWYTPDYSYTWRSNYYQVRALMYHSTKDNNFCLEDVYLGDKVLIYYWDDPKSAITRPRLCEEGEKSPYGFTNFGMPGEVFTFPEKTWGLYKNAEE